MSNVIKSYTVRYEEEAIKTIDSYLKKEAEILVRRKQMLLKSSEEVGFIEGLQAVVVEPTVSAEEQAEKAEKIIESARADAKSIIDKAKLEAEQIKAEALAVARKQGYEEGFQRSQKELLNKQNELEAEKKRLRSEYEAMRAELEPEMVEIIAALIEKITGVLVEDHREIILHLVERAFLGLDRVDEIRLRVGREDYEFLSSKKEYLIGSFGREIQLYITEDPALNKNQCLIETEQKLIDCSLDVQLSNLITDLKLLGSI